MRRIFKPARGAALMAALLAAGVLTACNSTSTSSGSSASEQGGGGASSQPAGGSSGAVSSDDKLAAMVPQNIRSKGTVEWLMQIPAAPMESKQNGELVGIDVELGRAIIARLGLKVKITTVNDFSALIPAISTNRADFVMSGMKDLKERQTKLDFVDYFKTGNAFIGKPGDKDKLKTYADLCGKTINTGVGASYTAQLAELSKTECQAKGKPAMKNLSAGGAIAEMLLQIDQGRATAVLNGIELSADAVNNSNGKYVMLDIPPFDPAYYGIAVNKSNPEFAKAIEASLQSLMDDGTYKKILEKYNLGAAALDKASINGALS
jgi:polar amino acid transport system substrate-binding protein